ncbi:MAG: 30S ribosomal protein S15 [Thermoplasmata archaeon]|jgi:small subunit ribosomal protein S15|nr:30S ribosomal protein S15 [Thermoplasmata archaeon]
MAKMHTRRKGKASSERPMVTENPSWVPLSATEIESKIEELAKEGISGAMIGMILRDQYAVPNVKLATGKTVTQILDEKGFKGDLPEDLSRLMVRAINLNVHVKANPNDVANKRGLALIEAKIRRLERYYKRNGVLPATWKYSLANAELMLK